jgi:hypothetical protein
MTASTGCSVAGLVRGGSGVLVAGRTAVAAGGVFTVVSVPRRLQAEVRRKTKIVSRKCEAGQFLIIS